MKRLFLIKLSQLLCAGVMLWVACKKNNSSPDNSANDNIPTVTAIGKPVGAAVNKLIGVSGGSLTSSDGRIQLTIPAGALSAATNVSIQPVTNNCPGGKGLAYDLQPNGTKFSIPASLSFHYADSDLHGMSPVFLISAYQDSSNAWQLDDVDKDVDSINKIVSFDLNHFSTHGLLTTWTIDPDPPFLRPSKIADVQLTLWIPAKNPAPGDPKYINPHIVNNSLVSNWQVSDGLQGGKDGTISGTGSKVKYTSPASIDNDRFVALSVMVQEPVTERFRKGKIITFQSSVVGGEVKLISDVFNFDVDIFLQLKQTSFFYPDVYTDGVKLDVQVKGKTSTILFTNRVPDVEPPSGRYGTQTITWIPDDIGEVNIVSAKGIVDVPDDEVGSMTIDFTQKGTVLPKWLLKDQDGNTTITGGQAVIRDLGDVVFKLDKKKPQQITLFSDPYTLCLLTVTPKP